MNKKYLIYDNLVRGSGLGHFLLTYNYGLNYAIKNELEYLPIQCKLGHGLGHPAGLVEKHLGLPICNKKRKEVLENELDLCEVIKYQRTNPCLGDFTSTIKFFKNRYFNEAAEVPIFIDQNKFNISVSIRRGDLMGNIEGYKNRLSSSSDDYFKRIINKNIPSHDNYNIHIFSDGDGLTDSYIDDKGLAHSFKEMCNILSIPQDKTQYHTSYSKKYGDPEYDASLLFSTIKSCALSNLFIGSYSSFSSVIILYRDKKSILPKNFGGFKGMSNVHYEY